MDVAVLGVAELEGIGHARLREQVLEVGDRLGQALHRHHHVLGEEGGAAGTRGPGSGEEPLAQAPELVALGGVAGERGL